MRTSAPLASSIRASIRRKLLRWYDRNRRDLPWRRCSGDPYAQWVAEIMLQQTRVETVIEYYERFLARFPDLETLARADHEKVLKHWEGLGYYRRILHLHEAARIVCVRGEGIPTSARELRDLPGVGEYTAAAIASIAFNERAAAVDGNVARVLARLFGVTDNILSPEGKQQIQDVATQLMPAKRCGDFNQAWMDLGSAICTPKSPSCESCPLASPCDAAATGRTHLLPVRNTGRNKPSESTLVAALFVHDGRMLVRRRPPGGLWSGLWEFPTLEISGSPQTKSRRAGVASPPKRTILRVLRRLAADEGLILDGTVESAPAVQHQLTHRSLTFYPYVVPVADHGGARAQSRRWVASRGFARLSVSTAHRRIYAGAKETISELRR